MKFNKAFTLAEILIVMAVIGVIGALTIPNLTKDYEEEEIVTRVKTAYNDIELAYQKAINKYGPYDTWNSSLSEEEKIKRVLDFIKGNYLESTDCLWGTGAMYCIWGIKKETDNGTIIGVTIRGDANSSFRFFVYTLGNNPPHTPGVNTFEFNTTDNNQTIIPRGFGTDRNDIDDLDLGGDGSISSSSSGPLVAQPQPGLQTDNHMYNATNWVVHIGNLEYNKCNDLNWETQTTCE